MKFLSKIIIGITIFLGIFSFQNISYSAQSIEGLNSVKSGVNQLTNENKNIGTATRDVGIKILNWFRIIFSFVLVIFIVYAGIQMILSQGTDDDSLKKAKTSLWYAIVGMIFVNFPVEVYGYMKGDEHSLFLKLESFSNIFLKNILLGIEILIGGIAVFILVYEGIKVIIKKNEEALESAKKRIKYIILALIFLGFIELWRQFLITGEINRATGIFSSFANLALYIAGPIALFFISLAGYYYIFSNGDEEKAKKGKNIIINTCIGIVLVLCIYILLNDLSLLQF